MENKYTPLYQKEHEKKMFLTKPPNCRWAYNSGTWHGPQHFWDQCAFWATPRLIWLTWYTIKLQIKFIWNISLRGLKITFWNLTELESQTWIRVFGGVNLSFSQLNPTECHISMQGRITQQWHCCHQQSKTKNSSAFVKPEVAFVTSRRPAFSKNFWLPISVRKYNLKCTLPKLLNCGLILNS